MKRPRRTALVDKFMIVWAMLTIGYTILYIYFPSDLQAGLIGFAIGMFFGHLLIRDQAKVIDRYSDLVKSMLKHMKYEIDKGGKKWKNKKSKKVEKV